MGRVRVHVSRLIGDDNNNQSDAVMGNECNGQCTVSTVVLNLGSVFLWSKDNSRTHTRALHNDSGGTVSCAFFVVSFATA